MDFNPLDYDVYHMGLSGGKDSTATLLWLVYESGWPADRIQVTFCDTGNEDPLTYAFLGMLSDKVHPVETIHPERDFWELARWKKRFPSRKAQFCTQWLKIIPTREHILNLLRAGYEVLALNGVRAAEDRADNNRGQVPQFNFDAGFGCDVFRPILDWSLEDVWEIHRRHLNLDDVIALIDSDPKFSDRNKSLLIERLREHRIPRNPIYDMGASRVGCFPCINSRKAEVRAIAKFRPEKIDFIEGQEEAFTSNPNMISTFFTHKTVPERFRTIPITTTDGEKMMVAGIRDVVKWSKTKWGARQFEMDLDLMPKSACDIGGFCE